VLPQFSSLFPSLLFSQAVNSSSSCSNCCGKCKYYILNNKAIEEEELGVNGMAVESIIDRYECSALVGAVREPPLQAPSQWNRQVRP
ncbi:hypothetical protein, partial [Parabacteroides leei]|uniref:hypothetical protein n=1 Tax=Parabacteroides leei TaxID=2939491 RepID=UPI001E49EA59